MITTSFLFFVFRNPLHEESDLCQAFQNHFRLFGRDGSAGPFFEDPLGAKDELRGKGGHGGELCIYVDFDRTKNTPCFGVNFDIRCAFLEPIPSLCFYCFDSWNNLALCKEIAPFYQGESIARNSCISTQHSFRGYRERIHSNNMHSVRRRG